MIQSVRSIGLAIALVAAATVGGIASPAQDSTTPATSVQAPPVLSPPTPVFKTTVRRVVVDVVVTDAKGNAVQGLTKQDFSAAEDGKPQQILSFDASGFDAGMDYLPPKLPAEPANSFVNLPTTPERGPLYVLLYDLVNMDNQDQMAQTVNQHQDQMFGRQQLVKFIQNKPEGSRFAIFVRSDGLHLIQGFTSDKQQLLAAVDPHHPGPHIPQVFLMGQNFDRGDTYSAIGVMRTLAQYLDGLPGRKNLIWFSGGFPLSMFPSDEDVGDYAQQVRVTLDLLAQNQIAIYPVDVRGVVVPDWHASYSAQGGAIEGGGKFSASDSGSPSAHPTQTAGGETKSLVNGGGIPLLISSYQVADEIAKVTGGRAYYSTNDVASALADATQAGEAYYTLTYSSTNQAYDGKLRSIRIDLDKKGYTLAYRRAYFGIDTDAPSETKKTAKSEVAKTAPPARQLGDHLYANMEHGAPIAHQLIFGAHLRAVGAPAMGTPQQMAELATQPAYFKVRRRNAPAKPLAPIQLQRFTIDYTVMSHQLQVSGVPINLEIAAAAYDADGKMLNAIVNNAAVDNTAAAGQPQKKAYRALQEIDVPLAAAWVRVAVRDANTDRIGAMEIKLPLAAENESAALPAKTN